MFSCCTNTDTVAFNASSNEAPLTPRSAKERSRFAREIPKRCKNHFFNAYTLVQDLRHKKTVSIENLSHLCDQLTALSQKCPQEALSLSDLERTELEKTFLENLEAPDGATHLKQSLLKIENLLKQKLISLSLATYNAPPESFKRQPSGQLSLTQVINFLNWQLDSNSPISEHRITLLCIKLKHLQSANFNDFSPSGALTHLSQINCDLLKRDLLKSEEEARKSMLAELKNLLTSIPTDIPLSDYPLYEGE